ncbi:hypothetical protein BGZ89_001059, partial [Linnemannia elongata]
MFNGSYWGWGSKCFLSTPAFFEAFYIYVKQHGHQRKVIEQSNLDKDTQLDLLQKFSHWKVNDEARFWLDRQSQSSQIRTASILVKRSESYAKDFIRRRLKGTGVVIVNDRYTYSSLGLLPQSFSSLEADFCHVDVSTTFLLRETNKGLYDDASKDASKWFKARIRTSTELTIAEMRKTRFQEDWIHDLLYD